MKRLYAFLIAGAAVLSLVSCGVDYDEAEDEEITTASGIGLEDPDTLDNDYMKKMKSFEFSFDDVGIAFDEDGNYIYHEFSDEIPKEAAYREDTHTYGVNGDGKEYSYFSVSYCDKDGNELLRGELKSNGKIDADKNFDYEFDKNGNMLMMHCASCTLDDNNKKRHSDIFIKYKYDDAGREIAEETVIDGQPYDREYTDYDEYGNVICEGLAIYHERDGVRVLDEVTNIEEKRNIKYDSRGNIISYDKYTNYKDTAVLRSSFTLTYDEKDRVLSSEEKHVDYDKEDSWFNYTETLNYEYGADCDSPTLYTETEKHHADDSMRVLTEERRYDEKGRVVYYKYTLSDRKDVYKIIENEYKDIK